MKSKKVIDLFAGVGGMSLGFEMAGFEVLLANEYDKEIANAYKENHRRTKVIAKDITQLPLQETFGEYCGCIDVVIGGPPCQGFSQKGQRKTINDERNFLFKYYVKVVELVKPQYFVMENVPNLLTAEKGFFIKEIEEMFAQLGYVLNAGVLNAADYGVPQNRRRAVIIGKKTKELNRKVKLPIKYDEKVSVWDAISDLAYLESGEGEIVQEYIHYPKSKYQKKMRDGSSQLFNHQATKHSELAIERLKLVPPEMGKEVLPSEYLTKSIYSGTWSRMMKNDVSVTITTRFDTPSSGRFSHPFLNRAITVREAARLQSFPDTFKFIGTKCSQMKQVGNAVPPLLAKAIAESILEDMKLENTNEKTR